MALREVRVTFDNGNIIETNMASHLNNDAILDYYKIGKTFNIGSSEDLLVKVSKVEILK
jgi:hypothetical protein